MASYLSYFTSSSSNAPSNPSYGASNTSTGSTWSSTFSSRIATLRKALTKDAEEDDPDNEDCSHVSNVLRAYYTEKGRTFPEWLPPDPKKPAPAPPPPQIQYGGYGNAYGNQYGNQYGAQPTHGRAPSGGRGGLSDLWDSSPTPPPSAPQPQSLRAPRPTPQSLRSQDSGMSQSGMGGATSPYSQPSSGARPLPSQRAGSYQNTQTNVSSNPAALGSRDRLRARLQGGNSGRSSPAPQSSGGVSYSSTGGSYDSASTGGSPYVSASEPWAIGGGANPYAPRDAGQYSGSSNPYGNQNYRQRPGGPR
jgi:hypothetical protein